MPPLSHPLSCTTNIQLWMYYISSEHIMTCWRQWKHQTGIWRKYLWNHSIRGDMSSFIACRNPHANSTMHECSAEMMLCFRSANTPWIHTIRHIPNYVVNYVCESSGHAKFQGVITSIGSQLKWQKKKNITVELLLKSKFACLTRSSDSVITTTTTRETW